MAKQVKRPGFHIEGFYNPHRGHSSLGNLSPAEFERKLEQRQLQTAAS